MGQFIQIWRVDPRTRDSIEPIELMPEPDSLDEAMRLLPDGGYTTFRTYGRYQVLHMASHFDRLEETARLLGEPLRLNHSLIINALHQALTAYPADETRVRLLLDLQKRPGAVYILIEKLHVPAIVEYQNGVGVVTRQMHRENPKAKQAQFIETAEVVRQRVPAGVNEVIMVSETGHLLEGLSSNFFAVADDRIWTAEKEVLSGITRALVLDIIRQKQIPLTLEGFPVDQLGEIREAFITSASRAVLPVTIINGEPVGSGKPGQRTLDLLAAYRARVAEELETL